MVVTSFDGYLEKNNKAPSVVAIGMFDGVHLGHAKIINKMIEIGNCNSFKKCIITFDPHPDTFLKKDTPTSYITLLGEKISILQNYDVDYLIIIKCDESLLETSPHDFVTNYLCLLNIKEVVVGFDFSFGYKGLGTPSDIETISAGKIKVTTIPKLEYQGEKIGSTWIRKLLKEGKTEVATKLLGHPFKIKDRVVEGNKIGRTIDLRTANIVYNDSYACIKEGVYGVIVYYDNNEYIGLANCGHNPSFNYKEKLNLEINILDFNDELYDKEIEVAFITYIREEKTFSSSAELLKQIENDKKLIIKKVKAYQNGLYK